MRFWTWNFHLHLSYFNMCCGFEQMSNSLQMWSHLNYKIWLSPVKKQRDEKWLRRIRQNKFIFFFRLKAHLLQFANIPVCVFKSNTINDSFKLDLFCLARYNRISVDTHHPLIKLFKVERYFLLILKQRSIGFEQLLYPRLWLYLWIYYLCSVMH